MNRWPDTRTDLLKKLRKENDPASWEEFYSLYWRAIYSYALCHKLKKEDAEDIVQEVFIKILRKFPTFDYDASRGRLRSWVKAIARTTIIDFFRRKNARITGKLQRVTSVGGRLDEDYLFNLARQTNDDVWEQQWRSTIFYMAMERVQARVRENAFRSFYLFAIENQPANRVAKDLGISRNNVYVNKNRIVKLIREEAEKVMRDE